MRDSLGNETETKERQLRLRAERAERRLAELLSTLPYGYVSINRDWIFTFANEQAVRAIDKERKRFLGQTVWSMWPEVVGTNIEAEYRRVMETRAASHFEYYSSVSDSWTELHVYPIEQGIGVYFQDITQRRRAEEALKASEQRYRAFTELNPQLILMADTQGQVTFANQRLLDYSGMTGKFHFA